MAKKRVDDRKDADETLGDDDQVDPDQAKDGGGERAEGLDVEVA